MVLHKNKWDHKAKIAYLKKHGLTRPKQAPQTTPKWSSKKKEHKHTVILDSDDSDWDSEDEELLNHFYPEIGEQNVSVEQKVKIKRQIIHGLREKQKEAQKEGVEAECEDEQDSGDEMGGIYLGTEPDTDPEFALPDLETKLSEFVVSDAFRPGKSRKLLKQKVDDTLLEDYGIGSYKDTVKNTDYAVQRVELDKLSAADLDGMRIGAIQPAVSAGPRVLSAQEQQEHLERQEKDERARLYEQIRTKFGTKEARNKILEINNIDESDTHQLDILQGKLTRGQAQVYDLGQDLHDLVGVDHADVDAGAPDLDELLQQAQGEAAGEEKKRTTVFSAPQGDDDFLDELLG